MFIDTGSTVLIIKREALDQEAEVIRTERRLRTVTGDHMPVVGKETLRLDGKSSIDVVVIEEGKTSLRYYDVRGQKVVLKQY